MPTFDKFGNLLSLENTSTTEKYTQPGAAGFIQPPAPAQVGVDRFGPAWLDPAKMRPGDWTMQNGEWVSTGVNPIYGPMGTIAGSTPETSFNGYQGTAGGLPVGWKPPATTAAPPAAPSPGATGGASAPPPAPGAATAAPFQFKLPYAGFDITKGSNDPAVNRQVYGSNYFPGNDPGFMGVLNKYMPGSGVIDQTSWASLDPTQQGLYRQALAEWFQTSQGSANPAFDPFRDGNMGSGVVQGPPGTMPGNQGGAVTPSASAAPPPAAPTGNSIHDWTIGSGPFAKTPGALGDTTAYSSNAVGEGSGPPLRMHTPYEEIVLSPEYQFQKDRLKQDIADMMAAKGRYYSQYADQFEGDQLRGLLAGEISRQDETNFNRAVTLNDLLFNRNRTQDNTDYSRAMQLAAMAQQASNPQNTAMFGNNIVNLLIQQAMLEAQLGLGAGGNTAALIAGLGNLGIDITKLLAAQQTGASTSKPGTGTDDGAGGR